MAAPLLTLPGKVNASNALVIVAEGSGGAAGTGGAVGALSNLLGKVDSSNRLVVRIGA
jgi:hypothetical protein